MYKTTGIAGRSEREAELAGGLERFSGAGGGILIKKMKSRVEGSDQFRDFDELAAAGLFLFCSHAGNQSQGLAHAGQAFCH